MKVCTKCKLLKEYSQFFKRKDTLDGYQFWCKICTNNVWTYEKRKEYRIKNRKRINDNIKIREAKKGARVYCYVDRLDNSIIYVGSTTRPSNRTLLHKRAAGSCPIFHGLIKENGFDRYEYKTLEIVESPQDLKGREQFYIDLLKPIANMVRAKV